MVAQMTVKIIQVPHLARSAMAPEIRATVITANTAWKATKAIVGRLAPVSAIRPLRPKYWNGLPSSPAPTSSPKDME
jgi:hypothetical protein